MSAGGWGSSHHTWPFVEDVWTRVAERVGGRYRAESAYDFHAVQRVEEDWIVTLQRVRLDVGYRTLGIAPFHNPRRFRLEVRAEGVMDDLWKKLGFLQDVELGDAAFDARYVVKGHPSERVREVLGEHVRELIRSHPRLRLRVGRSARYGLRLPAGVDALLFDHPGETRDVERLVGVFELFSELLPRLRADPPGWETDPDALVRRLLAPGGRGEQTFYGLVIWQGDAPRRDAAERLGALGAPEAVDPLLSVLHEEDTALVAAAVDALGRIGDRRAAPALVRLLGARNRKTGSGSLADHAAAALRDLGLDGTVEAFQSALEGDPDALPAAAGPHRSEVVRALMQIVDSAEFGARARAARALGALGANEALPLLREKSTAWGMKTTLTEAAAAAVEEIEARASLPRPADRARADPDTHPRPAGEPGTDDATLPRPADGDPPT